MKFAEHLSAHITPEWRKQYIQYEYMKEMLYSAIDSAPTEYLGSEDEYQTFVKEFDEQFFNFSKNELNKIDSFFSEKLAEAHRNLNDLKHELNTVVPGVNLDQNQSIKPLVPIKQQQSTEASTESLTLKERTTFSPISLTTSLKSSDSGKFSHKKYTRKIAKKVSDLKLAFSEFYLNLVLLQNYQSLNFTGFRKILKKHDKLLNTRSGNQWRIRNIDQARFYQCKDVDQMIEETENIFSNVLEEGDRSKAMKRLRVPPLGAKHSLWTTYKVGFYSGALMVLFLFMIIKIIAMNQSNTNYKVMCQLFRGPFFIFFFILLLGLNVYGWRTSGVNHVLIFELNPRDHISEQHLFEISFFFAVIWTLSVLGYVFTPNNQTDRNLFPLINVIGYILFLFNPTQTFCHSARFWLIRQFYRLIVTPLFQVKFADFWIADQLNSFSTVFSDIVFYFFFYTNVFIHDNDMELPSGTLFILLQALFTAFPAWFRFAQCLRRYRDANRKNLFPHVVNAGKYSTSFFVILFSTMTKLTARVSSDHSSSPFFNLWILTSIVSSIYSYIWDVKMDWGLLDSQTNENCLLREELVYQKSYYHMAYIFDFFGRTMWVFTISLTNIGFIHTTWLVTIACIIELFRRCVWNFFRLENEHLNNCGNFRAVRDISITPVSFNSRMNLAQKISKTESLISEKKSKRSKSLTKNPEVSNKYLNKSLSNKEYQKNKESVTLLMEKKDEHSSESHHQNNHSKRYDKL